MLLKSVGLLAVVSVAMCLVPAGAHFFELSNKMSMAPPEYITVQKIYAGWSFFGIAVIAALSSWGRPAARAPRRRLADRSISGGRATMAQSKATEPDHDFRPEG